MDAAGFPLQKISPWYWTVKEIVLLIVVHPHFAFVVTQGEYLGFAKEFEGQWKMEGSGRWSIYESQKYMEVLKQNAELKALIKELSTVLPRRAESQIRAHHQKMLKKYGSIRDIIRVGGRSENQALTNISFRLDGSLGKFKAMIQQLAQALNVDKL